MNAKKNNKNLAWLYLPLLTLSGYASADYKTDIGYSALSGVLGSAMPTGAGVKVTQVEASTVPSTDPNYPVYAPDPTVSTFASKTFAYPGATSAPTTFSGHAQGVGNVFYGNGVSMAAAINDIHSYEVTQWILSFLEPIQQAKTTDRRIANHSWVGQGDTPSDTSTLLRLVDRQVERNEYLQVAATSTALLGNAYNVIAVGLSNGTTHGSGAIDGIYVAGRTRPDLVAPAANLSTATPIVSATAALLVQTGHQAGTSWSQGSTTITGVGTVYNAERSETIKAALMAGADRQTSNTSGYGDLTDYRSAGHQTANGLDDRYGAGQVNVYNSYYIIAGGEQNSLQDGGSNNGQIGLRGFDYDSSFGGANGSNTTGTYTFTVGTNTSETLYASLVWNLKVSNTSALTTTLHHLGLSLWDITANTLLSSSSSLLDNSQNLFWTGLIGGHSYQLQVTSLETASFTWDYALAWRREVQAVPIPAAGWFFGVGLAVLAGAQRRRVRLSYESK